ncbi:MAG: adenosine deaminase, partial [Planctomycetota bacterium]
MAAQLELDETLLRRLPKVVLHEHLDGSCRPATLIELAEAQGYDELPTTDAAALGDWFFEGADRGSLPLYLEGFRHTVGLLQTEAALERVAFEYLEDSHRDGVVYSEVRFAPHLHTFGGLGLDAVMHAVLRGLHRAAESFDTGF